MVFNAATPELLAAANKADSAGGNIARMMHVLLDELEPMQAGFVGAAGASFTRIKGEINTDLIAITRSLDEVAEGVRSAGRDFDVADSEARQEVDTAAAEAGGIVGRLRGGS